MNLSDANAKIGFWQSFGFIDLDRGNVWPREYRWACGCIGVSLRGESVRIAPCDGHLALFGADPEDAWEVRTAAFARVDPLRSLQVVRGSVPAGELSKEAMKAIAAAFDRRKDA